MGVSTVYRCVVTGKHNVLFWQNVAAHTDIQYIHNKMFMIDHL